jgi:hypothetical protein
LFWVSLLFWFLAINFYFTKFTMGAADSRGFHFFGNTHSCVRQAFSWELLKSPLTILIRELRDEVSENFENLSEKRDLIQCTGGTPAGNNGHRPCGRLDCVPQQTIAIPQNKSAGWSRYRLGQRSGNASATRNSCFFSHELKTRALELHNQFVRISGRSRVFFRNFVPPFPE